MIWTEGEDNLKTFIIYINSIHPTIKFTHEYSNSSNQSLSFLDVQVNLNNNQIQTDLHTKPTDKHQYLLKSSCHPAHTKRTIPFSLALRLRRFCSTDHFFNKHCYELINFLALRGYSHRLLKREVNRVRNISRQEVLKPRPHNNQSSRTPFVITFNPALPNTSATVRKNLNILHSSACSLRSKRFRGAKSEERGFRRFARAKNGARAKKGRRGWGRGAKEMDIYLDFENLRSLANRARDWLG